MAKFALRAGVIVLLATGAGLIRARNLPWIPDVESLKKRQELHQTLRREAGVSLERFLELIEQGAVVIDARPRDAFEEQRLRLDHYPPVINIPPDEIDEKLDLLEDFVGLPVVLYCTSNECDMAEDLYPLLQARGFTDIWIFFPGFAGILEAGLPTASGPELWHEWESALPDDAPPLDAPPPNEDSLSSPEDPPPDDG